MRRRRSRPALAQLALSLRCRSTLDALATGDLLLAFSDVVQRLAGDGLVGMLLCLRGGTTLDGSVLPCDILLGLGDVVESRRVELAGVLRGGARCAIVVVVDVAASTTLIGQDALGYGRRATLSGLSRASDGVLGVGDLADDLGSELLADVLLGASSRAISDGSLLVGEGLFRSGDLGEKIGVDGDRHLECCAESSLGDGCSEACNCWCCEACCAKEERHVGLLSFLYANVKRAVASYVKVRKEMLECDVITMASPGQW
jgi:hypothetical protein